MFSEVIFAAFVLWDKKIDFRIRYMTPFWILFPPPFNCEPL